VIQCSDGEFKKPHGVVLDSKGKVYVSERSGLRIQKFDPDGNFITKWDSEGTGNGQFLHLHDTAMGPGGSNRSRVNQEATNGSAFDRLATTSLIAVTYAFRQLKWMS